MKAMLIFILLFSFNARASCEKNVTYLTQGALAPCTGFLFSPEKELEVRTHVKQNEIYKQLVESQDAIIKIQTDRILNYEKRTLQLMDELQKKDSSNFWKSTLYFMAGVVVTGYIVKNVAN